MICEHCHANPASVHMVQVVNGKRSEQHLCQDCAEKMKVFEKEKSLFGRNGFTSSFDSLMHSAMDDFFARPLASALGKGFGDFVEIDEPGLLGGQGGYGDFKEKLKESMGKSQSEKVSDPTKEEKVEDTELAKLKKELAVCISREEYERAAEVRDKIKALEA